MDWKKVDKVPNYNPFQFQLAREVRGSARYEIAQESKISTKRISDIEKGNIEATEEEVKKLSEVLDFPIGFFEQFHETTLDCSGFFGRSVQIDYYKYKIFRDINPPQMAIVQEVTEEIVPLLPTAKIIDFKPHCSHPIAAKC